jgi:multicomponent Na+:H+ antiporter subunit D
VTSLLTLYAVGLLWSEVFWGPVADVVPDADRTDNLVVGTALTPRLMLAPTVVAVVAVLSITVLAGPLYALSERAAQDLVGRDAYVDAVLGQAR